MTHQDLYGNERFSAANTSAFTWIVLWNPWRALTNPKLITVVARTLDYSADGRKVYLGPLGTALQRYVWNNRYGRFSTDYNVLELICNWFLQMSGRLTFASCSADGLFRSSDQMTMIRWCLFRACEMLSAHRINSLASQQFSWQRCMTPTHSSLTSTEAQT